jgi:hypothetical protein
MFKAYASSDSLEKNEEEEKPIVTSSSITDNNNANGKLNELELSLNRIFFFIGNTWLENKSFSIAPPIVSFQPKKSNPVIEIKPKEEKKPVQNVVTKKPETNEFVFSLISNIDISHLKKK